MSLYPIGLIMPRKDFNTINLVFRRMLLIHFPKQQHFSFLDDLLIEICFLNKYKLDIMLIIVILIITVIKLDMLSKSMKLRHSNLNTTVTMVNGNVMKDDKILSVSLSL